MSREDTAGGRPATVRELEMSDAAAPFFRAGDRVYAYLIEMDGGDTLVVATDSTRDGDYESHKATLDAMMDSLAFTGGAQLPDTALPATAPGVVPSTPPVSPSASPSATPTLEPVSMPTPTQTLSPSPSPTQTSSAEVFPDGNECDHDSLGYVVGYPADWFANEAVEPQDGLDGVEACQYFGEEPMEIGPNAGLPPTVTISFSREDEVLPPSTGATVLSERSVTVDGQLAIARETEQESDAGFSQAGDRGYSYYIELPNGGYLHVNTSSTSNGDYEAHTEVLDQMMETLEFIGS